MFGTVYKLWEETIEEGNKLLFIYLFTIFQLLPKFKLRTLMICFPVCCPESTNL